MPQTVTSVTRESLNTQRSGTVRVILGGTGGAGATLTERPLMATA